MNGIIASGKSASAAAVRVLAVILAASTGLGASDPPSELRLTAASLFPGERAEIFLQAVTGFSFKGFSVSAAFDPGALAILEVTRAGTMSEAIRADFFEVKLDPAKGVLLLGVLADAKPPFDDSRFPGIGEPLAVARLSIEVPDSAPGGTTSIRFVDGLGEPPIRTLLVVDNDGVPPDLLVDGVVDVLGGAAFIRGDANGDGEVDISDPIRVISYLFLGGRAPGCPDAADGNDDEGLDLTDAVFLLDHIFVSGRAIPPPFPLPGLDPEGGGADLGCLPD